MTQPALRSRSALLILVLGTVLFGGAMATRTQINPWWTTTGAAVVVLLASWSVWKEQLRSFEFRTKTVGSAVALGVAMVAGTHLCFELATEVFPGLDQSVAALYGEITPRAPAQALTVMLIVIVAIAEEVVWRGLAVELCQGRLGRLAAGTVAVSLYTIPQLVGGSWVLIAAAVAVGSILTAERLQTGGIAAPIVTHAIWSASIFSVLPLG